MDSKETQEMACPEPFGLNKEQREGRGWVVIGVDNFAREDVEDFIVCRDVRSQKIAQQIADALNAPVNDSNTWYKAVAHDHKLCRGMWNLI